MLIVNPANSATDSFDTLQPWIYLTDLFLLNADMNDCKGPRFVLLLREGNRLYSYLLNRVK